MKYIARYTKTFDLNIEVEAETEEEAIKKADKILNDTLEEELLTKSDSSYWDRWVCEDLEE